MHSRLFVFFALSISVGARIRDPAENDPFRTTWFLWEDNNGRIHNESLIPDARMPLIKGSLRDIQLMLYTQSNPYAHELIDLEDPIPLNTSTYFKAHRANFFIIHGWNNDYSSPVNELIKDALLDTSDVNVFVVHWGKIAHKFYTTAKAAVPGIGFDLGMYLQDVLDAYSLTGESITLIGHSLGAHVAGAAGAAMATQPHAIVALDPAGPLFSLKDLDNRVDASDARHVQVVHTCGGYLAFKSSLGHADYFPNGGGAGQPGCGLDVLGSCAHARAYRFYAESLYNCEFRAVHCKSYKDFKRGLCDNNEKSYLGCFNVDKSVNGDFFLNTNSKEPFVLN